MIKSFITALTLSLPMCTGHLKESSVITAGDSNKIPQGLIVWCNGLDKEAFFNEPECQWYCRTYSKTDYKIQYLKTHTKAGITTCMPN